MPSSTKAPKGLKLTDILVTVVIAVVFGLIYRIWGPVYDIVKIVGLQAEQLTYGVWYIAATVAFLIIRKPGVALLAEVAAALFEMLIGSHYSVESLTYGIAQGIGAEIVFALFAYRSYSLATTCLAGIGAAAGSLAMDWYKGYLVELAGWNLTLYFVFRLISALVITGGVAYYLVKALEATGVTRIVRPVSEADRRSLHD
ncbi:ECF transporter S component [Paenibacillus flagellatus]|uniref:Thiamine ABC transporter permease n=1 Tax=Paenibacillus flagellatus TaxID=2211139 RepID=A0A2V5K0J5_9BACL|nr:ECF transporter S component [Paenibacillus flagellatus]PYI52072.1 thiamine ABC transporter permease [Paenibacillus flagellatus]